MPLVIKGKKIKSRIIQGGMGVGVSLAPLASAVAKEGGVGVISSAALDRIVGKRIKRKIKIREAVHIEIANAKNMSAGGHLGFKMDQIELESNTLENLLPAVKDMAKIYGDFPVVVAGGIYTRKDIEKFLKMGADGVQMGTRFLATEESSANAAYKSAVVGCAEQDIVVVDPEKNPPGSPCGLPFRIIRQSPMFEGSKFRKPLCNI